MTMLKKLRSRRRSTTTSSRRRLKSISPAAVLLLHGVSGSDNVVSSTPVDWSKFANEMNNNERITQEVVEYSNSGGEAMLTAAMRSKKDDDDDGTLSSLKQERSLVASGVYHSNRNSTSVLAVASPTPPPPRVLAASLKYVGNDWEPLDKFPLNECEGDCDEDNDCAGDLICFQRKTNEYTSVPGCLGGNEDSSGTDYCIRAGASLVTAPPTSASPTISPAPTPAYPSLKKVGNNWDPASAFPLGECEGDCDRNSDCKGGMICFQRTGTESVPGCLGGETDSKGTDYCVRSGARIVTAPPTTASPTTASPTISSPPTLNPTISSAPTLNPTTASPSSMPSDVPSSEPSSMPSSEPTPRPTTSPTRSPTPIPTKNPSGLKDYTKPGRESNLGECEGDCDRNRDCVGDLICYQRKNGGDPLPGCEGTPNGDLDFCIKPEYTYQPTPRPTRRPTPRPTRRPTRYPTAAPTFTPIPGGSPVSRIKLYWQKGYMWQDVSWEERYCLQCRNWKGARVETCDVDQEIEIEDCGRSVRQKFVRVESDKTIRPAMSPDLCISHQGHADDIYLDTLSLRYCDGSKQQQFDIVGTPWQKYGKFEIRTSLTSNRQPTCWTNPHHPRRKENIIPQRCDRARDHETSSWTLY